MKPWRFCNRASLTRTAKAFALPSGRLPLSTSFASRPHQHKHPHWMTISAAAPVGSAQQSIIVDEGQMHALAPRAPSTSSKVGKEPQDSRQQSIKTIYLIRHGEGWHNIGYDHNYDPHLTPRGWAQTGALQQHLSALQPQLGIQLVVVSPLRRTLETAAGVFGVAPNAAKAAGIESAAAAATTTTTANGNGWVWMHPQAHKPKEVTQRHVILLPAAGCAAAVPAAAACNGGADGISTGHQQPLHVLAHEGCRERIGPNVCDKFRAIPRQSADFPGVDFSLMQNNTDVAWEQLHAAPTHDGGCYVLGEEEAATEQRALKFYSWLMSRPESHIAVVSHCGFLVHGMRAIGKTMLKAWNHAMLQQCSNRTSASGTAAVQPAGGSSTAANTSSIPMDPRQAELLRDNAGDIAGRMSLDWMNCEMRSIQLGWGPEGLHQAGDGDQANDTKGWLWATPGNAAEWFAGGLVGL